MTELVRSQSEIFLVMGGCGLAAGLMKSVICRFVEIRALGPAGAAAMEVFYWVSTGFLVSEFFYYCDNGKITFLGIAAFLSGLWLWKKLFCDILTPIGGRGSEEKGTSKHIRSKRTEK